MKKIVTLLLALSTIIAVSFALSSCDAVNQYLPGTKEDVITVEDGYLVVNGVKTEYKVLVEDENPDNTEDDGNTDNGDNNESGDNNENGDNNTEVRTTVTAEEWKDNLEQTNFTVGFEQTQGTDPMKCIAYFTATAISIEIFEPYEQAFYIVNQDGLSYEIFKADNGSWVGGEITNYPFASIKSVIIGLLNASLLNYPVTYDSVVYNTEKKTYNYSIEDENGTDWTYWFYFEEGKIIKVEVISYTKYDDGTKVVNSGIFRFSDIGTTIVEVPEFIIESSSDAPPEASEDGNGDVTPDDSYGYETPEN